MRRFWIVMFLVGSIMSLHLAGCSRQEKAPAAKPQARGLIDVVHDVVKAVAKGDKSFNVPEGITIKTRPISREEGGRKVDYLEISGMKQLKDSLSVIVFRVPVTWFAYEKAKLAELDMEKATLKACAEKLQATTDGRTPAPAAADQCRVRGITANGKEGIAIVDDRVRHIEMLTYSLK